MPDPNPYDQFDSAPASSVAAPPQSVTIGTPKPQVHLLTPQQVQSTPGLNPNHSYQQKPDGSYEDMGSTDKDQQLTPDALDAETSTWILTGQMSPMGMGGGPVRIQIENNRPVMMQKYGIADAQLPAIRNEFKSDSNAYQQRVNQLSYMQTARDAVNQHIQQIATDLKNLPAQTDSTALNAVSNWSQRQFSGRTVTDLDATIPLLEGEVGRIMSGNPTSGAGGLTDDARHEFDILQSNVAPEAKIEAMQKIVQMTDAKIHGVNQEAINLANKMNGGLAAYAKVPVLGSDQNPQQQGQQQNKQTNLLTAPTTMVVGSNGPPADPRGNPFNPQQAAAFDAWVKANPNATPDQLTAFVKSIGVTGINNPEAYMAAVRNGTAGGADTASYQKPDISDVRGHNPIAGVDATIRNAADALTLGTADKIAAAGDTIFGGGTMKDNLARQYAITDYDWQHHPGFSLAGQVAGGLAIPFGDMSTLPLAASKGAAYGAAYGVGSSRSLGDVPLNALGGAITGAAVPAVFAGAGKVANALRSTPEVNTALPPLVDPKTGELNQVMDAMSPAQRYQFLQDQGFSSPSMAMTGGRTSRVIDQGFSNLPPSAGLMEDQASTIAKEARAAMDATAAQYGTAGSLNEAGNALQSGVNQWLTRAEGVRGTSNRGIIGRAYDAIPIHGNASAALDNTRSTLQSLTSTFPSNPDLAAAFQNPTLAKYLDALTPKTDQVSTGVLNADGSQITRDVPKAGNLSWSDLKAFRTEIGNMIGDRQFIDNGGTTTNQLRALYGSLSKDMEATANAQGPKALNAFNRANNLYNAVQARKEQALVSILGPDAMKSPEAAALAVQNMAKSSGGDLGRLAQIKASMAKSGEWNDLGSTLIRMGGLPGNGEGRAFNPQTYLNWYSSMTEPARNIIFGGQNSALRQSLDNFTAAAQQLAKVKSLTNTSNTTPTLLGAHAVKTLAGGVLGAASVLHPLFIADVAAGAAGEYGLAKLWTSPKFVQWATGYAKAAAQGNTNAVKGQMWRLQRLAVTNPELRDGVTGILRSFANDNVPASGQAVASPDQGPQNQAQSQ